MHLNRAVAVAIAAIVLIASACGDSKEANDAGSSADPVAHASTTGAPGKAAREICEPMVRQAVEFEVGAALQRDPVSAVVDDTFSCRYEFSDGAIDMSVRDLHRRPAAQTYFDQLRSGAGSAELLPGLGDAAFLRPDGSLELIKDAMVLTIDVSGLPTVTPGGRDQASIASDLGATVMGCWVGA